MKIFCVQCEKDINGMLCSGKEIYPHRVDLYEKHFYKCPHCGNFVGCHPGTKRPLGCIPTNELKQARKKLHDLLDPLWKSKKIKRTHLYKQISKSLGYTYHTGNTKSIEECNKISEILLEIKDNLNKS